MFLPIADQLIKYPLISIFTTEINIFLTNSVPLCANVIKSMAHYQITYSTFPI